MKQNTFINALRGFSALWVIIAHCCLWGGYKGYIPDTKVAVGIFMMVSGFLMMYTVNLTHKNESFELRRNWLKFYLRRFFRISPGYYLSLLVAIILFHIYVPSYHALGKLNHNTYLSNLSADFGIGNVLLHVSYLFGLVPSKAFSTLLPDWMIKNHYDNIYLFFAALFLMVSLNANSLAKKINYFFDNSFFLKLSDLSFSVYLFHGFFLSVLWNIIESKLYPLGHSSNQCVVLIIFLVVSLTYLFAIITHQYIELPGMKLGKFIIKKLW